MMKLHGHTKIELTDIHTGEKKIYEDDNIVTNGIAILVNNIGGVLCNDPIYSMLGTSDVKSTVLAATGGLMLFDDTIEEDAGNIHPPAGVSVVGCGAGISYDGDSLMAGSYSDSESGFTNETLTGYKHVWNFSTAQANGTIKCACLTTQAGGKITEGIYPYASDYVHNGENTFRNNTPGVYLAKTEGTSSNNDDRAVTNILYIDGKNNRLLRAANYYEFLGYWDSTSTYENFKNSIFYKRSIDISVYRFGLTNISIFDRKGGAATSFDSSVGLIKKVTVNMPEDLAAKITDDLIGTSKRYWGVDTFRDGDYIYITIMIPKATGTQSSILAAGDSAYIWKINVDDFTSTYYTFTNNTDESICFSHQNVTTETKNYIAILGSYVFCVGSASGKIYMINIEDNTDITIITYPDGEEVIKSTKYFEYAYTANGRLYAENSPSYVFDPITAQCTYKNRNLTSLVSASFYISRFFQPRGQDYLLMTRIYGGGNIWLAIDPTVLVTINNLSSAVTKTASQSMKVTYTITQEEEAEV